jgi:hypothetical protein
MDSRIPRIRSKLAKMPYQAQRSHSACGERHQFRLGPRISSAEADAFEAEHHIVLPAGYRAFLIELGGSGASPFYGLLPLDECRLFTGFLRGCPGLQAGEESDSCGAGQGQPDRRQGDPASTPHGRDAAHNGQELSTVSSPR